MPEGRLLRKLITAGVRAEPDEFRRIAEEVIHDERAKKHHLLANDLERILYGQTTAKPATRVVREVPTDRERGLALLELHEPVRDLSDIVLSEGNRAVVDEVVLEQGRSELLGTYGLKPVTKLLLCGPPGCGKTLTAEVLATELGLELAVVRTDAAVSSYLGETAANLRRVFDFIEAGRYVVLFDEFDAIGKEREDPSEHGELKRVVNAFLQMLDGYRGKSLVIAATNHESMLDSALWRRFDEVMVLDVPSIEHVHQLLELKLRAVRSELPLKDRNFLSHFKGMTHAQIERVVLRAIKNMVLQGREFVTADLVDRALTRERKRAKPGRSRQRTSQR
jgi:SpoVK/Ycf46/Vps4 family AAA+-type ATPase